MKKIGLGGFNLYFCFVLIVCNQNALAETADAVLQLAGPGQYPIETSLSFFSTPNPQFTVRHRGNDRIGKGPDEIGIYKASLTTEQYNSILSMLRNSTTVTPSTVVPEGTYCGITLSGTPTQSWPCDSFAAWPNPTVLVPWFKSTWATLKNTPSYKVATAQLFVTSLIISGTTASATFELRNKGTQPIILVNPGLADSGMVSFDAPSGLFSAQVSSSLSAQTFSLAPNAAAPFTATATVPANLTSSGVGILYNSGPLAQQFPAAFTGYMIHVPQPSQALYLKEYGKGKMSMAMGKILPQLNQKKLKIRTTPELASLSPQFNKERETTTIHEPIYDVRTEDIMVTRCAKIDGSDLKVQDEIRLHWDGMITLAAIGGNDSRVPEDRIGLFRYRLPSSELAHFQDRIADLEKTEESFSVNSVNCSMDVFTSKGVTEPHSLWPNSSTSYSSQKLRDLLAELTSKVIKSPKAVVQLKCEKLKKGAETLRCELKNIGTVALRVPNPLHFSSALSFSKQGTVAVHPIEVKDVDSQRAKETTLRILPGSGHAFQVLLKNTGMDEILGTLTFHTWGLKLPSNQKALEPILRGSLTDQIES